MHVFDRQTRQTEETDGRIDEQKGLGNTVHCTTYSRTVKSTVFVQQHAVTDEQRTEFTDNKLTDDKNNDHTLAR